MPMAGRIALRWLSQHVRIRQLERSLGERLLVVDYAQLHRTFGAEVERICAFVGCPPPRNAPSPVAGTLDRWRSQLDAAQIAAIDHTLSTYDEHVQDVIRSVWGVMEGPPDAGGTDPASP